MSYEMLVALDILDNEIYDNYRKSMMPILKLFNGNFGYDFKVSEVLIPQKESNLNRVFTINFPNKKEMERFFSNEEYIKIKRTFFDKSVGDMIIISSYNKM